MRPAGRDKLDSLYFRYPVFPFQRPAELDGAASRRTVVVVGAGPVGLLAALTLARFRVPVVVLDDKSTVNDGSRAICISRHSLEILQRLGVDRRLTDKALGWIHGRTYFRGRQIFRLEMPHSEQERFYPMYNLQQQYIEQFLAEAAREDPFIEMRWQNRAVDLDADADGVTLSVDTPEGRYRLQSDYILAADGARSLVRQRMDLPLRGEAYEGRYVIADIHMHADFPTERRCFFDSEANPGSTILIHKQPDNIWRIDYQLEEGQSEDDALRESTIRARVGAILAMVGETADWELEWWSIYKAYTLCLDAYRHGRVLFLGDAAHLVPIFGVRGLNNGIADGFNAGWKLASVVHGSAPDALLDSYTPERRGATLDVFANSSKSTKFMTPPTRGYKIVRSAALSLALTEDFAKRFADPRQVQPYTYADSPLISFPQRDAEFTAGPRAGGPLLNRRFREDEYLLDHLGRGFSVIYFADAAGLPDDLLDASDVRVGDVRCKVLAISRQYADIAGVTVLVDDNGDMAEAYGAVPGSCYLVRPDLYVAARWRRCRTGELRQACAAAMARNAS